MTDEQTPAAGPLTAESVKLLKRGDWLRVIEAGSFLLGRGLVDGGIAVVRSVDGPYVDVYGPAERSDNRASRFAFIGRPDADGWIPWSGGENPVPGKWCEWFFESTGPYEGISSDALWNRVTRFRLASSSSVVQGDASGVEREFLDAEAMAEAWSDRVEIQRMVETTSAVFAKWASPELLSRFRQQMMGVIQQAYIEGVAARVEALRPQPSGETREAVARIVDQIEVVTGAHGPRIRPGEKARVTNAILALLSPAAPDAGGGALRAAAQRMADDWQSSAAHHPEHVLVRKGDFEALVAALQPGGER